MDSEAIAQFEEQIKIITGLLATQSAVQEGILSQMKDHVKTLKKKHDIEEELLKQSKQKLSLQEREIKQYRTKDREEKKATQTTKTQTEATKDSTDANKNHSKGLKGIGGLYKEYRLELAAAAFGLNRVVDAIDTTAKDFSGFATKITTATGGIVALGVAARIAAIRINPLAGFLVVLGGAALAAASSMIRHADELVKARDPLLKMGAGLGINEQELQKLAHRAGFSSKTLGEFTKTIQTLGPNIVSLGNTASQGTRVFAEIADVGGDVRREFRRLGIESEELTELQAQFINLQRASGRNLRLQIHDTESLRKRSLDYARNLSTLAALTGKDIDTIQKEQREALAHTDFMIDTQRKQAEIADLQRQIEAAETDQEKESLLNRKKAIQAELDARDKLVQNVATQIGDPAMNAAFRQFITTGGAVTEETIPLIRTLEAAGYNAQDMVEALSRGEDVTDEVLDAVRAGIRANVANLGQAAILGGEEVQKQFGLTTQTLEFMSRVAGTSAEQVISETERRRQAEEEQARVREEGFSSFMDTLGLAREAQLANQQSLDRLRMKGIEPVLTGIQSLIQNFDNIREVLSKFAGPLLQITGGLLLLKLYTGLKGLIPVFATATAAIARNFVSAVITAEHAIRNPIRSAGTLMRGAGRLAAGAVRFAGPLAGAAAAVGAGYGAFQGGREDNIREALGLEDSDDPITARQRFAGISAGALSGLSFGMIDRESMTRRFAGERTSEEELESLERRAERLERARERAEARSASMETHGLDQEGQQSRLARLDEEIDQISRRREELRGLLTEQSEEQPVTLASPGDIDVDAPAAVASVDASRDTVMPAIDTSVAVASISNLGDSAATASERLRSLEPVTPAIDTSVAVASISNLGDSAATASEKMSSFELPNISGSIGLFGNLNQQLNLAAQGLENFVSTLREGKSLVSGIEVVNNVSTPDFTGVTNTLTELAQSVESPKPIKEATPLEPTIQEAPALERMMAMNNRLMESLAEKIDTMIDVLEDGNDNTSKLVRFSA